MGRSLLPAAGSAHATLTPATRLERTSQLLCQVFYEKFQSSWPHFWESLGFAQVRICAMRATFRNPAKSSRSQLCNVITPFSDPPYTYFRFCCEPEERMALKPSGFVGHFSLPL